MSSMLVYAVWLVSKQEEIERADVGGGAVWRVYGEHEVV